MKTWNRRGSRRDGYSWRRAIEGRLVSGCEIGTLWTESEERRFRAVPVLAHAIQA